MSVKNVEQGLKLFFGYKDSVLDLDISSFLADGAMRNLAKGTLSIYRRHLLDFQRWIGDKPTPQITPQDLRSLGDLHEQHRAHSPADRVLG